MHGSDGLRPGDFLHPCPGGFGQEEPGKGFQTLPFGMLPTAGVVFLGRFLPSPCSGIISQHAHEGITLSDLFA